MAKRKVKTKKSPYEGLQKGVRTLKTPKIEVWKNQYPDKNYAVCVETDEFTCICPKTGLPDFARFSIAKHDSHLLLFQVMII